MKKLLSIALVLCLLCAPALAETLTTNGGTTLDTGDLPYCTQDEAAPVVYFLVTASIVCRP